MNNHHDRPEILSARSHGSGVSTRRSESVGMTMMYVALPIRDGSEVIGYARTAIHLDRLDEQLSALSHPILIGAFIAAALALALGLYVSWQVTAPLASMAASARAIARGRFDERIPVSSSDEVGDLGRALNAMREELLRRMETIATDRSGVLAILTSMVEGVVAVDRSERVVHMNTVAGELLGIGASDALGKRIWEVTRLREVNETLSTAMRDASSARAEATLVGGGRDRVIELNAAPLRDAAGVAAGAVLVLHDVTELRRLEAIRRDFVANVSHELKTPLTAVRGIVETLIDDDAIAPEKRRHFLARIHDQTLRLSALVNDLLTLSRVESKETPLERVAVDLRELAVQSASDLAAPAQNKGLILETRLPKESLIVVGDREALGQAIANLLDNAVKYTPAGGTIRFSLARAGDRARMEVRDNGIGIEPREQERIFERFYRVDKGRSRDLGGTGLGLAIVRNVVRAHGGEIIVESAPGAGSAFIVLLPLAPHSDRVSAG
jgi:two-component system phosphate regulon sensor histidine kinase PhoR